MPIMNINGRPADNGKEDILPKHSAWELIDAILIINMDGSTARWKNISDNLDGLAPREKIHRISAVRGTSLPGYQEKPWFTQRTGKRAVTCAGAAGCALSHAKALRFAKGHSDWNIILVLEDDAQANQNEWQNLDGQLADFIQRDQKWELIYLSYNENPKWAGETHWSNIFHCSGVLGTASMIIHRRMWDKLLEHLPDESSIWPWLAGNKAVDYWLKTQITPFSEVYYISPAPMHHPYGEISEITGGLTAPPEQHAAVRIQGKTWAQKYSKLNLCILRTKLTFERTIRLLRRRIWGFRGRRK